MIAFQHAASAMPGNPSSAPSTATPQRPRGRGLLWLVVLVVAALAAWQAWTWWHGAQRANPGAAADGGVGTDTAQDIGDPAAAIAAVRRDQRELAQRMTDVVAGQRVLREEVLGVGERAALVEQSVARIAANPPTAGEQALRLDEAELLLTIGQQQIELSADAGAALHAYALADDVLAGSTDPATINLRQSLAAEMAALRALPPDPRTVLGGRLDAFAATVDAPPFVAPPAPPAKGSGLFDRIVGSMVEVHRDSAQDLLDPASRQAGLTAVRLEITLARLALERRDTAAFHAALGRIDGWLVRLFDPATVASQRALLAPLQHENLRIELPALGGTLRELRRLRLDRPALPPAAPPPAASAHSATPGRAPAARPAHP
ncbi:MAG: uroporphyrinogen-III C-methyltransferase [Proteobacteria bacterium]|nr:uroporphyrinogen-III C-methyltransferase [Pseudomonadota bacterium]